MDQSLRLLLPRLAAAQAQKHVTHNEALDALDALVHLAVESRGIVSPASAPAPGDRFLLGPVPTGAWVGHGGQIAEWRDDGWTFHVPRGGWTAWIKDEGVCIVHDGTQWRGILDGGGANNLRSLGIGTASDPTNILALKSNAALFTARVLAEGGDGDMRFKLNKEQASDVGSLMFQSSYSGRAEIGLVGDNDLQFKVSENGTVWRDGLKILASSGTIQIPAGTVGTPALAAMTDPGSGIYFPQSGTVAISAAGAEPVRFTSSQILAGTSDSIGPSQAPSARLQVAGTAASSASMALGRFSANSGASSLNFIKSRAGMVGGSAAIALNDVIGQLNFDGDTGAGLGLGARIAVAADGPGGAGSMPARIAFSTSPTGSVSPIERLRIAASGAVSLPTVGTTASAANAFLDAGAGNAILRSTSSRRYKTDIRPVPSDTAERILALSPVRYRSTAQGDRPEWTFYGLVAEDVAEIDPRLVHWTPAGGDAEAGTGTAALVPDAVQYDRIGVLLIDVVRNLRERVIRLERQMATMKAATMEASPAVELPDQLQ
jgi:hypothetical protein